MRIANNGKRKLLLVIAILLLLIIILTITFLPKASATEKFDGQRAYEDVKYQVELGPRTIGSTAHEQEVSWIVSALKNIGWQVETQETTIANQPVVNIIAKRGGGTPWVILGSHYDSRPIADQDPNPANRKLPVPGANDGASSTAVLMEIARVIPNNIHKQVWLVFFDAEDTGNASGSGWANGSEYFVSQLQGKPDSAVILDMIGDKSLDIYMEQNSNNELNQEIWGTAKELGYSQFIPEYKYSMIDDHIPFVNAGIKAADVIDFDYPAWHTISDTVDKVSAESLQAVGDTILKWMQQFPNSSSNSQ